MVKVEGHEAPDLLTPVNSECQKPVEVQGLMPCKTDPYMEFFEEEEARLSSQNMPTSVDVSSSETVNPVVYRSRNASTGTVANTGLFCIFQL